ncbi:MAG: hypothetical protein ACM3JJ_07145 [Hyphomicrobiales bacterium]
MTHGWNWPAVILITALGAAAPATTHDATIDLGGLVLSVSISRTAETFHIVDQLAQWDPYAHRQYVRWGARSLALDAEDRRLLARHASLRRARGWGQGFEQAFLVPLPIDVAAKEAVAAGLLTDEEASSEREILEHFAPKLDSLMSRREAEEEAFESRLAGDRARLQPLIQTLVRFTGAHAPVAVPVFLVANPDSANGGGEANGGRLVIEVPGPDPEGVVLHEALHFLLRPHEREIQAAADSSGIPFQDLNEGIAYALSPGLTDDPARRDQLVRELARRVLRGTAGSDPYARFYMIAAVFRPILRRALDQGWTFERFLPEAVASWRRLAKP